MDMIENFLLTYESVILTVAEAVAHTLELIGIIIVVIGTVRALIIMCKRMKNGKTNVVVSLGRALMLALEFKMGAEIVNTVVFREFKELAILGLVILIRVLLAVILHWEIKSEQSSKEHSAPPKEEQEPPLV